MRYFLDRSGHLFEFVEHYSKDLLIYPDINDPRNYAIDYYKNDQEHYQVLRSAATRYHSHAIKALYYYVSAFQQLLKDQDVLETLHLEVDYKLNQAQYLLIYYGVPEAIREDETWGCLFLPEQETLEHKKYLQKLLPYFSHYDKLFIYKRDEELLYPLNEDPANIVPTLKKIIK